MCRNSSHGWLPGSLVAYFLSGLACQVSAEDFESLRLNQLQFVGTHNSYHLRPNEQPRTAIAQWDYSHAPLEVQLNRGVRSLALDLHYTDSEFEVFHLPKVDEGTSCRSLATALQQMQRWSASHPRHVPLVVFIELKEEGTRFDSRLKSIDAEALETLDDLISTTFSPRQLMTPSDVQGESRTLQESIVSQGWPTLGDSRGRVMFVLNEKGAARDLYQQHAKTPPGRPMFVRSDPARSDAALVVVGNPEIEAIRKLLDQGYLVRSRSDSGLSEGRAGDTARRDTAMRGGAHIITTDFPPGEEDPDTGYVVQIPTGTAARVNPVSGPAHLRGKGIPE